MSRRWRDAATGATRTLVAGTIHVLTIKPMVDRSLLPVLVLASCLAPGCGDPPPEEDAEEVTYYRDIKPIFDAYCVECHVDASIAPIRLDSYETVREFASVLPQTLESRTMPPFLAAPAVRPLKYDRSLSEAQIELVSAWALAGAPMGDPAAEGPPVEVERRELDRVDRTLEMPESYAPLAAPDEYRCFVIDWDDQEAQFITGVEFFPGNRAIAHHAVVYLVSEEHAGAVDEADGADGRPGYSCFGGPSPDGAPSFPSKQVGGWAPGAGASIFPDGAGTRIDPGVRVILQMHYSILNDGSQPDRSSVGLRLEPEVEHDAGYLPWLDLEWTADPQAMLIPAGEAEVTHEYLSDPTLSPLLGGFVPGVNPSEGLVLHSVFPHMHKLGKRMSVSVERQDGSVEPLVNIDAWDFDWQEDYVLGEPVWLLPGDRLRLSCTWDNSAANQPVIQGERREPADVSWGEGTYDEMCAASLLVQGIAGADPSCAAAGSIPADAGRFVVTFDASASVRDSVDPGEELLGTVYGAVYHDEDVSITGPKAGAEQLASFAFDGVDLREGASSAYVLDTELPAGRYQLLGYMDSDANVDPGAPGPDSGDPVLIPGAVQVLSCQEQPITMNFGFLLP